MKAPGVLLIDIETAPNVGYTWGKWEQNVIDFEDQWYILSFAYKWLGGKTQVLALPDFKGYSPGSKDRDLMRKIHSLLDKADIVIAQNGDAFDIKKINSRLLIHKMTPPAPYKTIDTLKVLRNSFAMTSNKLDDVGKVLEEGEKVKHRGFDMWLGCMAGKKNDWEDMKRYNKQDVDLLEKIYLRLRPWMKNHPNMGIHEKFLSCPKCFAHSDFLMSRGTARSQTMIYKRFQCKKCGGWCRGVKGERNPQVTNA